MKVVYDLDVLKPHEPGNDLIARSLKAIPGVKYVAIKIDEIDNVTTSVFITIQGTGDLELDEIKDKLEELNCALHSVDKVYIYDDDWPCDYGSK
jgi:hypothetical protein